MKLVSKMHRIVLLGLFSLSLIACGGSGDGGGLFTIDPEDDSMAGSDIPVDGEAADGGGTSESDIASDGGGASDIGGTSDDGSDSELTLGFLWSEPVGINTVQGSPLISDAELIITGGNFTSTESAQIKAYSTSGLPQAWTPNPESSARKIRAYSEVAGDPNGNLFAIRIVNDDDERVRLVTRNASGQQLALYHGGTGQLRTAPSIDAGGRVVFTISVDSVGIRNLDGYVESLPGTQAIGTMSTKPAISRANIAYFSVTGSQGLVGVNLTNGDTSNCLGALPSWSSPAIGSNGNVIFGTTSGRVMACAPSMSIVWTYPDDDLDAANSSGCNSRSSDGTVEINMTGSPVLDAANNVYIRSNNGFIYSLSAEGKIRWCHDTQVALDEYSIAGSPVLTASGHLIYVDENGVSALRISDGVLVSRLEDSRILPLLRESNATPTITPSGLLIYRIATYLVAITIDTTLDNNASWPKWGADLRNGGLQR